MLSGSPGAPGLAIGVDVGGTKLAGGLVAADGGILDRVRRRTPDEPDALVAEITDAVTEIESRHGLGGLPVGVGIAGIVDSSDVVRWAPNLPLVDRPIGDELTKRLDRRVTVDNDANVAAWGEFHVGAGAEAATSLLMLTVGTGVGGGLVLDGNLVRGAHGFAAEFGHILVLEGGPACPCGNRGCLEPLASGTGIGRHADEAIAAGRVPAASALHAPGPLTGKRVTVAAHTGDRAAIEILAASGFWLGVGIASLANALDPEFVVVGGGAIQAGELLLGPARAALADRLMGRGHRPPPPIVRAQLADDAGFVGAALLGLHESRDADVT
jgi:glucokinase